MKTTYIVEISHQVLGYFHTLRDAKSYVRFHGGNVLMMRGQYFGEGFHRYRLYLDGGKWKRVTV